MDAHLPLASVHAGMPVAQVAYQDRLAVSPRLALR
jgi:hypothetical protein